MRRRPNKSVTISASAPVEQVLRYFEERLADRDFVPGVSDLVRLIQYRRELADKRPVRIVAGWVRDARK